jgi:uncharacterized protein YprB with RNaseH-like and TPR domain
LAEYYFDIETTGLNPFEHKILTIQLKTEDEITVWKLWEHENEIGLIEEFRKYLRNIHKSDLIYGYNNLKFDLPFLSFRAAINGAIVACNYRNFCDRNWIDLYQYLGGGYVSMDRWLESFGVKRSSPIRGIHIPHLFEEKRFAEIEEHAKEDVILCEELVEHLNKDHEKDRRSLSRCFCERVSRSILAKHYLDYSSEKLKRIYD